MKAEHFLQVAEVFSQPALLLAADGRVLAANPAVSEVGWTPALVTGRRLAELSTTPPDRLAALLARAAAAADGPLEDEIALLPAEGEDPPLRCRCGAFPVGRADGDPAAGVVVLRLERAQPTEAELAAIDRRIAALREELGHRRAAEEHLRQAETVARESEQRFRALMEQAPFSIQVLSPDGRTVRVNRAWEELWGLSAEQLGGYNMLEDHQLEAKGILPLLRRAFAGEAVALPAIEYDPNETIPDRTWHADPRRWVSAVAYPLKDTRGEVREVVLVHDDITARRRAEAALAESEQKFRLMADTIPQLAWMARPDGHIFWYNRRWYDYTGTTADEMEGWGWQRVHDPAMLPTVVARWQHSLATGEPFDMVFPLRGADGCFRPFLTRVNPLRDDAGNVVYWFGTNTDIAEQKLAEDASRFLADASAILASVTEHESALERIAWLAVPRFGDWCVVDLVEPDGAVRRVAVAHSDPAKLAMARRLQDRYPPGLRPSHALAQVIASGEALFAGDIPDEMLASIAVDEEHLRLLRGLGLRSYLSVPMKAAGKVLGVLSFVAAESGRRYGPAELALADQLASRAAIAIENARLYGELVEADRRKDEFLATLAHELRNPLAPIRNSLQVLKLAGTDPAAAERSREMMERQLQHLVRLVDDLLDVSRVMRGKIELQRQRVDLRTVVAHAVETAQPAIDTLGHTLTVDVPDTPLEAEADPVRLTQVVANLLTNAAKYTPREGRIAVVLAAEDGHAVIRVRDNGIGIPRGMLHKVFDLFVQADTSVARAGGGLGIGLTLVRSLVTMHGGDVEARSAGPGQGTEMVVRLPLQAAAPASAGGTAEQGAAPGPPRRRILVVDDNVDAAESLAMLLEIGGHAVQVANDGPSALSLAGSSRPELVLLDIGMPGMDGYEVARRLRADPATREALLVALTGWGQDEDRRRSAEAGFDLHLVKPADPADLHAALAHPRLERRSGGGGPATPAAGSG